MSETETSTAPPACPADGIAMRPSTRKMLSHDIASGRAIPHERVVDVWRCPVCGREAPRP